MAARARLREGRRGGLRRGLSALRAVAALSLVAALSGCLVSDGLIELGPRATPLEPGLYVSFDAESGAVDEAMVVRLDAEGGYFAEEFSLAFYESGLAPDLYFLAYREDDAPQTLYGLARAQDGVIEYPFVDCALARSGAPEGVTLEKGSGLSGSGGCALTTAQEARAALEAAWRAGPAEPWSRLVRQTELRR